MPCCWKSETVMGLFGLKYELIESTSSLYFDLIIRRSIFLSIYGLLLLSMYNQRKSNKLISENLRISTFWGRPQNTSFFYNSQLSVIETQHCILTCEKYHPKVTDPFIKYFTKCDRKPKIEIAFWLSSFQLTPQKVQQNLNQTKWACGLFCPATEN